MYDDNSGGRFAPCRGGYGAYGGIWSENVVSGIARDILVEAMFRIEAAGYPIVMHVHDEVVAEVPPGFGSEEQFLKLLIEQPSWAPDLPIAASAWSGHRYDKTDKPATGSTPVPPITVATPSIPPIETIIMEDMTEDAPAAAADVRLEPEPVTVDEPVDDPADVACVIAASFTSYKSSTRLSKLYELGADGKVIKTGGTEMSRGKYETVTISGADPASVLTEIGSKIDIMKNREAIGIGVVKGDLPLSGDITTKEKYKKCHGNARSSLANAIPRAKSHFGWPPNGRLGVLFFDGDEKDGLHEILTELWPDFAEVAGLARPSASASVKDPNTGERLKAGEHLFVLNDEPSKSKEVLEAIRRLSWCRGVGRAAGWLGMAIDGDPLEYGPVDVTVGAAERLIYEGEVTVGNGIERLPRNSTLVGGTAVFCAVALLDYADEHAPVQRYDELVAKAKNDPVFLAEQKLVKAKYRADHIEASVAKGIPREEVEKEFDRVTAEKSTSAEGRIWRELSPHHVLYFTDGTPFLASEMAADPKKFHGKECADPVEGLGYQSRNPGIIFHDGGRMVIYSRAHSDRYAYFLKLFDEEDFGEDLKGLINDYNARGLGPPPSPPSPPSPLPTPPSPPSRRSKQIIQYGPLSYMADAAASVLLNANVPFYQRGKALVRPVVKQVQTFDGKVTSASQLADIDLPYLRDTLCKNSVWVKFNKKSKKWLPIHPPVDPAQVLLKRFGDWEFPELAGIINTPTLRPDGTVLKDEGYDPATQLLLIDPPAMPEMSEHPTKEEAASALDTIKNDLLFEFMFDDDEGVSRAVALSAIISTVCRGAFPVVPMHIIDAPTAGSGKSYLLSTVSRIATGQAMPVLGAGKSEEELEKRLGAAVIHGQALICVDNIVGEIGGDALCRLVEQPRPNVRILGQSTMIEVDARSTSYFGNGNNVVVVGDLCRRVVRSRLDPQMERPELRVFKGSPEDTVMADRGKYIAACLTICRAYIVAGRPGKLNRLASFGGWSDTVRSALVWLGEADPVKSMDLSKAEDPETAGLRTMLTEWKAKFGAGSKNATSLRRRHQPLRCQQSHARR